MILLYILNLWIERERVQTVWSYVNEVFDTSEVIVECRVYGNGIQAQVWAWSSSRVEKLKF